MSVTPRVRRYIPRRSKETIATMQATNIPTQRLIIAHPLFRKGAYGTDILTQILKESKT